MSHDALGSLLDSLSFHPRESLVFNSGFFLFLFFGFLLLDALFVRRRCVRVAYLLLFSLYFYYKASGICVLLLAASALLDFQVARGIFRTPNITRRRVLLGIALAGHLGLLGYFKYANFFAEIVRDLTPAQWNRLDIILPAGISFFTFQALSYVIDVYRDRQKPAKNILDLAFYISFFPTVLSGPITRASDLLPQIEEQPQPTREQIGRAVFLILSGLVKKAVIADYISVNFVNRVFDSPLHFSGLENLLAVYGYALQIYCDFSGYSDLAIGIALLLGFELRMNFNAPYAAATLTEFWRRWHISLSMWLRDYVYTSLCDLRYGKIWKQVNLLVTMLACGLWHGAALRFVMWGGFHGLVLAIESILRLPRFFARGAVRHMLGVAITFHIVCLGWIFFRARSYAEGADMLRQITTSFHAELFASVVTGYASVFSLMLAGYALHHAPEKWETGGIKLVTRLPAAGKAALVIVMIWIVVQVKSAQLLPFIYFQF